VVSEFKGKEMELYRLGRMNVDGVIRMEEEPTPRDILAVVDRALAARLADQVVRTAALHLPPLVQEAIRWAIEHAETKPQVSRMAEALAVGPRVLLREMKSLGLCPPRDLLLWGRLIRASDLLERDGETVESAAFQIGYSTGGALGKALKQKVGLGPTDLLRSGGLDLTLETFRRRVLGSKGNATRWSGSGS
jgi:AraC-like DNA-binding protein